MPPTDGNGSSVRDRARSSSAVDAQDGMFDHQWEDADLEAALEEREVTKEAKRVATADHKVKDDNAKALLANYHLAVGEVARIGRFRIKKREVAGNSVAFDTQPRQQLDIGLVDSGD